MPWPCSRAQHGRAPGSSCTTRTRRPLAGRHRRRRRWHRGGRRARRAAACRARRPARRGRPRRSTACRRPDLETPRDEREVGARRLAAGDERADAAPWRRARPRRGSRPITAAAPCRRVLEHLRPPSVPGSSVSTRNGRMNARGWRRWSSHEADSRAADRASRASPRRVGATTRPHAWRAMPTRRGPRSEAHGEADVGPEGVVPQLRPAAGDGRGCAAACPGDVVVPEHREVVAAADVEAHLAEAPRVEVERRRAPPSPARRAPRARRCRCPGPPGRHRRRVGERRRARPARTSSRRRAGAATARPCGRSRRAGSAPCAVEVAR